MLMDILRALSSPNLDIREKTLDIALDMLTKRNIDEVVGLLKKELIKTQDKESETGKILYNELNVCNYEIGGDYRHLLVKAIHNCAMRFPMVAENVVHILMDFLGDATGTSGLDVILFVREILCTNNKLRASILQQLIDTFNQIQSSRVASCALWVLGNYLFIYSYNYLNTHIIN